MMMMISSLRDRPLIGVIGAGRCNPEIAELAGRVGEGIARNNGILVCGGLGGVMTAAAKGAFDAGGLTLGILPGISGDDANAYISIAIPTGMDHARNVIIARASHGLIAISGGHGTLSEIALALKMGKPVVGLNSWDLNQHLHPASTPEDAVKEIFQLCRNPIN